MLVKFDEITTEILEQCSDADLNLYVKMGVNSTNQPVVLMVMDELISRLCTEETE